MSSSNNHPANVHSVQQSSRSRPQNIQQSSRKFPRRTIVQNMSSDTSFSNDIQYGLPYVKEMPSESDTDMEYVGDSFDVVSMGWAQKEKEATGQDIIQMMTLADYDMLDNRRVKKKEVLNQDQDNDCIKVTEERLPLTKKRGPYRKYTSKRVEDLIKYVIEDGGSAKRATYLAGTNERTGQNYVRKYKLDEEQSF
ncbi:uncharacterized protein BX664DRAFT_206077 [Halteromyces radiatus]|uniref:uncharacterized protein n=1 Tax=Halteromyces radiatus TaxID=101107 RepID=UPI002220051C|nr:uncharacterized protein BX664DRAFT_206077 [Halteromyces radiatus]KAI8079975.1 hypothetical protein BX664DRAFT_206077 [Halteromyces radiatus]